MSFDSQALALFGGILAFLAAASAIGWLLDRRAGPDGNSGIDNLNARIRAWWVMVALIGAAFVFGKPGVIVLFAFASFAALREFLTLTPTRRADHLTLFAMFFVVLPVQYYLIWIEWYGLYSIFIPVYVFLSMPILIALRGDTAKFMTRVAEMQWGVMIAIFCISHMPALLTLNMPGFETRKILLCHYCLLL